MEKKILEILKEYDLKPSDLTAEELDEIRQQLEDEAKGNIVLDGYSLWLMHKQFEVERRKSEESPEEGND